MNKVGIITLHNNLNYGAVLQSYATLKFFEEMGYKAELINYVNPFDKNEMRLWKKDFIENCRVISRLKQRMARRKNFIEFMKRNYKLSGDIITDYKRLDEMDFDYDVFVTGSDQTFNLLLGRKAKRDNEYMKTYFLSFAKEKKKISFASSMGESICKLSCEQKKWIKQSLIQYAAVSVRERAAADFIDKDLGMARPKIIADPTLLLSKQVWDNICVPNRCKFKYILFYSVLSDKWVIERVKKISKRLKLPVVCPHFQNRFEINAHFYRMEDCGPEGFISLVQNAAFVCTTSFHGTVFSLIYNKPFAAFKLGEGNRIGNLLLSMNLEERFIHESSAWENIIDKEVDYSNVQQATSIMRENAIDFLQNLDEY